LDLPADDLVYICDQAGYRVAQATEFRLCDHTLKVWMPSRSSVTSDLGPSIAGAGWNGHVLGRQHIQATNEFEIIFRARRVGIRGLPSGN
jgi:hypothetical protein